MTAKCVSLMLLLLVLLSCLSPFTVATENIVSADSNITRKSFPHGFIFGTSSSAYQYEGEARKSGRGPSIWDTFTHEYPEKIKDGSNGDVAIDFYHRYKEDIRRMKEMNMDAFKFSISWSRIMPFGYIRAGVNQEGIDFYNRLIDEIISNGLQPFATLFHWDTPQTLEDKYGGFLSSKIVEDFQNFAEFCFNKFGDRVKYWITFNSPRDFVSKGYDSGIITPGRCSAWINRACLAGNSATEPYTVAHNLLLAHAAAVQIYRQKYQKIQNGKIGIAIHSDAYIPFSETEADKQAVDRAFEFNLGWQMNPLTYGQYPKIMQELVGPRLPKFSANESKAVNGSYDFIGMNFYSSYFTYAIKEPSPSRRRYLTDSLAVLTNVRNGTVIGRKGKGIRLTLKYIKHKYKNPIIYITENGIAQNDNGTLSLKEALNDDDRKTFFTNILENVLGSIKESRPRVRGYFAWSFADNFDWENGYTKRYGLYYVDYKKNNTRQAKISALWFSNFLKGNSSKMESLWKRPLGPLLRSAAEYYI